MAAIAKISSALKTFSGKPLGYMSKALGVATVASVIYDAHVNGKERAYSLDEMESGDRFFNQYKQYMTSEKESATICKLKEMWFNLQQDFPFYHLTSKAKGYGIGAGYTIIRDLPLLALSAIALKFKTAGKVSGVLLALNGIKTFLYDVAGLGSKKTKNNY